MYKTYFRQAIQMLQQNLFISIISILGTALAIMMIMTLIVTEEIKNVKMAPEINRDRTLHIGYQAERDTIKGSMRSGYITYEVFDKYISQMKTPEYISLMNRYDQNWLWTVNKEGSTDYLRLAVRTTDASFWKIFSFDFREGRPFSEEELKSGISNAVLSETSVKKLFKDEKAIGKTIQVGFQDYKVVGIVKDVSPVFKDAGGDIWIPYTSVVGYKNTGYGVVLLAKSKEDFAKIMAETREAEKKYGIDRSPWFLYLEGPRNHRINNMADVRGNDEENFKKSIRIANRKEVFIFLILLLIPALNLSGFSLSRIKKRMAEIGIRKAFGAKKYVILIQVLYENMITSLIGGIIGLVLSYVIVFWMRNWLLQVPAGSTIPGSAMLSLPVFIAVFIVCLILNLLSAGLSAYKASRMSIVNSLNQNDR